MPNLELRLGRDVLTVANGARERIFKQLVQGREGKGIDLDLLGAPLLTVEPEVIEDEIIQDCRTGAQCIVINVFDFSPASLRNMKSLEKAQDLASLTLSFIENKRIQHPMIQIYPSKLPLDISSKSSLNEHCDQYKFVASLFNSLKIDGFLCAGFTIEEELKCALTGIRKVSDKTIVFDKSAFNNSEILDADFAPSSSKYYCFDYSKMNSIDELLDEAISKVNFGVQFLNVRSASPSKTAALFALTDKMDCCLDG